MSYEGFDWGKTWGDARVYAARVKRRGGGRLNSRREGRGSGVDCEGESMMSEKCGARVMSLDARMASETRRRQTRAACPVVGMLGGGAAGSSLYC
jgi:hypothetical protein